MSEVNRGEGRWGGEWVRTLKREGTLDLNMSRINLIPTAVSS